jgi:hypothetical protein
LKPGPASFAQSKIKKDRLVYEQQSSDKSRNAAVMENSLSRSGGQYGQEDQECNDDLKCNLLESETLGIHFLAPISWCGYLA